MNLNQIAEQLSATYRDCSAKRNHRTELSIKIKEIFATPYSTLEDVYCYANCIPENDYRIIHADSEFVYDLTVVKESKKSHSECPSINYIERTILCIESELNDNLEDIVADFQKLLLSNADDNIMVFKSHSVVYEQRISCLLDHLERYHQRVGNYHFIALINDTFEVKLKSIRGQDLLLHTATRANPTQ